MLKLETGAVLFAKSVFASVVAPNVSVLPVASIILIVLITELYTVFAGVKFVVDITIGELKLSVVFTYNLKAQVPVTPAFLPL